MLEALLKALRGINVSITVTRVDDTALEALVPDRITISDDGEHAVLRFQHPLYDVILRSDE